MTLLSPKPPQIYHHTYVKKPGASITHSAPGPLTAGESGDSDRQTGLTVSVVRQQSESG